MENLLAHQRSVLEEDLTILAQSTATAFSIPADELLRYWRTGARKIEEKAKGKKKTKKEPVKIQPQEVSSSSSDEDNGNKNCTYVFGKGKHKGEQCPKLAVEGGFCKTHQPAEKVKGKGKDDSKKKKTGDAIGDALKKIEGVTLSVRRNLYGNFEHIPTHLIFNEEKNIYKRQNDDGTLLDLTEADVEICIQNNLDYVADSVQPRHEQSEHESDSGSSSSESDVKKKSKKDGKVKESKKKAESSSSSESEVKPKTKKTKKAKESSSSESEVKPKKKKEEKKKGASSSESDVKPKKKKEDKKKRYSSSSESGSSSGSD